MEQSLDIEELQKLLSLSARPHVRNYIAAEIQRLAQIQKEAKTQAEPRAEIIKTAPMIPVVKIQTYAWDQSDKFIKIYVTLPQAHNVDGNQVQFESTQSSVCVLVKNVEGKNLEWSAKDLMYGIVPEKSYFKLKKDSILLMLKKEQEGHSWTGVTKADRPKDKTPKSAKGGAEAAANPQDGLMTMMKDLYDEGDDEMKRTIRKAWHDSQSKKMGGGEAAPME